MKKIQDGVPQEIGNDLNKLHEWCCVNKITIDIFKTSSLIFLPNLKLNSTIQIYINLVKILYSAKYLRLIIDSNLNYKPYINMLECEIG